MSLVYITKHDENIYSLNKFDRAGEEEKAAFQMIMNKKSRYVSKYHEKVIKKKCDVINIAPYRKIIATTPGIACHKTMGYAKSPLRNPCDFLRKHEGIQWKRKKEHVCGISPPVPQIPRVAELPKKKLKVEKDMIRINMEKNINAKVRRPKPKYAITCRGDTRELCNSGIMPAYIFSPDFGRLPDYMYKFNQILCDKQKVCEQQAKYQNQHQNQSEELYMLSPEERIHVIDGLKKNWYEKQLMFQRLPVVVNSIKHKSKLEKDLHKLEDDIVLLEYNPKIYICD